jgi:hypothetical protein
LYRPSCTESENDAEVGNVHHFDNGIEGGLKFLSNDPILTQPGDTSTTSRKASWIERADVVLLTIAQESAV